MTLPARTGRPTRPAAVAAALLTRHSGSIATGDLLPRICRDEGIDVVDADMFDIRGLLQEEPSGWRIYLSRHDSLSRQRLTLALLLGHYFLHARSGRRFVIGGFARCGGHV